MREEKKTQWNARHQQQKWPHLLTTTDADLVFRFSNCSLLLLSIFTWNEIPLKSRKTLVCISYKRTGYFFFWCVCNQTPKWTQIYFRCGTVLSSAFAQHIIYIQIVDTYRKSHLMFYLFVFETSTTSSSSIAKSLASNTFRYTFWPINNRQRNFELHTCESCNRFLL